jgi:hypothetical protein
LLYFFYIIIIIILLFHDLIKVRVMFKIKVFGTRIASFVIIIVNNKNNRRNNNLVLFRDIHRT